MNIVERVYKGIKIIVVTGDITKLEVDAIVNPANSQLIMGGGAAGAILRAGGEQIQKEALKKAPIPIGKAVATTGGKLKAKYVIHAPTMTRPAMLISTENARLATIGALECGELTGVESIAFPGLGTGVGGLGPEEAAEAMVQGMKERLEKGAAIKQITLVAFNADLAKAFQKAIQRLK